MTEGDNPQGGAGEIPGLAALLGADGPLASFGELLRSARADLSERVVEGSAGGGAVRVTMTGERRLTGVEFDAELLRTVDAETLGELVVAAANAAYEQSERAKANAVTALTGVQLE